MFDEIKNSVRSGMDRMRPHLDQMRVNAALLKMELRDKKDVVVDDLEKGYAEVDRLATNLSNATEDKAGQARDALVTAWDALKAKVHAATAPKDES